MELRGCLLHHTEHAWAWWGVQVMVLTQERDRGRLNLSTKRLERHPGDMLRNPKAVFDGAEEMAAAFRYSFPPAVC